MCMCASTLPRVSTLLCLVLLISDSRACMAIFTLFAENLSQHQLAYQLVYPFIPISAFSGMNACLRLFVVIRDFIIIGLINFGFAIINPRAVRVAVVLVSVCVSVKSYLTSGASVHSENTVTYSAGNGGQNICGGFSETAPLQRSSTVSVEGRMYS